MASAKTFTSQNKAIIAEKSLFACVCCGYSDFAMLEYDHIISRKNGGKHTLDNGQLLCHGCNQKKGEKTMEFTPCGPRDSLTEIKAARRIAWATLGWNLEEQLAPTVRRKRVIHRS